MDEPLRQRVRAAGKRCASPNERWNEDKSFVTIDGDSYVNLLALRRMVTEIDNALWELEQLRAEQAKWVRIPRIEE